MGTNTSSKKSKKKQPKERGLGTSIILILMLLHGIFGTILYYSVRSQSAYLDRPVVISLMVIHSLLNVIAVLGIWNWKKWGMQLYAASTLLAVVVGLISIGMWSVFYFVLPLAILGYLMRTKWDYFE
jgi:hypothetical protein